MSDQRWYVFDKYDCITSRADAIDAAREAERLVKDGYNGVHIAYMTRAQFYEYCRTNNLSVAWRVWSKDT